VLLINETLWNFVILILSSANYSSEICSSELDVMIFANEESLIVRILNPARLMNPPCCCSLSAVVVARDFNRGRDDDDDDDGSPKKVDENSEVDLEDEKYPREDNLTVDAAQGLVYLTLAMLMRDIDVIRMK